MYVKWIPYFSLQYRKGGAKAWVYFIDQKIPKDSTHFVMSNLTADSTYLIKLSAQNEFGMGEFDLYHTEIRTLKSDPTYVPELGVKGITWNSISLGWNSPPEDKVENIMEYITYYKITRQTATEEVRNSFAILYCASNLNYLFEKNCLKSGFWKELFRFGSLYIFFAMQ